MQITRSKNSALSISWC